MRDKGSILVSASSTKTSALLPEITSKPAFPVMEYSNLKLNDVFKKKKRSYKSNSDLKDDPDIQSRSEHIKLLN